MLPSEHLLQVELTKRGHLVPNKKVRTFVVTDRWIAYYQTEPKIVLKGKIPISHIASVATAEEGSKSPSLKLMTSHGKKYTIWGPKTDLDAFVAKVNSLRWSLGSQKELMSQSSSSEAGSGESKPRSNTAIHRENVSILNLCSRLESAKKLSDIDAALQSIIAELKLRQRLPGPAMQKVLERILEKITMNRQNRPTHTESLIVALNHMLHGGILCEDEQDGAQGRADLAPAQANTERFEKCYTVKEKLGSGAFSVVKRAVAIATGDHVAVKILNKTTLPREEVENVRLEVEIMQNKKPMFFASHRSNCSDNQQEQF